jgi:hypothetical protein
MRLKENNGKDYNQVIMEHLDKSMKKVNVNVNKRLSKLKVAIAANQEMADREANKDDTVSRSDFEEMKRYALEALSIMKQEDMNDIAYRTQSML